MNDEHLEAELERLDAQCQRMASEYCELTKAHSKLKSDYADLRFVCKQLGIYEKQIRSLKAEVERLTKAGDVMISEWASGDEKDAQNFLKALAIWKSAKEGKQS
jgi:predicted RNase H-like nuclease (RuvC/YqgF family)